MGEVIVRCRRCGFDIPTDAPACPSCGPARAPSVSRAARQVAGIDLPTRSEHRLPSIRPRRRRQVTEVGDANVARSAFAYASLFVLLAVLGAAAAWIAGHESVVLDLPRGTAERIGDLTAIASGAALVLTAISLTALGVWALRRRRAQRRAANEITASR